MAREKVERDGGARESRRAWRRRAAATDGQGGRGWWCSGRVSSASGRLRPEGLRGGGERFAGCAEGTRDRREGGKQGGDVPGRTEVI